MGSHEECALRRTNPYILAGNDASQPGPEGSDSDRPFFDDPIDLTQFSATKNDTRRGLQIQRSAAPNGICYSTVFDLHKH
jgi:hypothetical protein